jgi:hypothetical protein
MSDASPALATPEQVRANRRLGLLLAAMVIAVVFTFICVFMRGGLPRDPGVWRHYQLEQSGGAATLAEDMVGETPVAPILVPTPAAPVDAQEPKQ